MKKKTVLFLIRRERNFDQFNKIINEVDPDGFVTFLDNKSYYNGLYLKQRNK